MEELNKPLLRDYQIDVRDRTRATALRCPRPRRVILASSTGSGKSVVGMDLILRCYEMGKRALFIVSGRALVNQFERFLSGVGVPFGVIMAGRGRNWNAPIQIASKETLAARSIRKDLEALPQADLVIIDEAHESTAPEWVKLLNKYADAVVVGLTATPALGNGKGLGHVYNGIEKAVSTARLVSEGWLVPCKVFAPDKPNLRGVKVNSATGDYDKEQLAERMNRPKITGNVLTNWRKHADGRRTVVFGCTIAHAKSLLDEFNHAGVKFRHIDENTSDEEREEIFGLIQDGKIYGFTNVSVARRGLDLPSLECACVVRPTKSLVLWLQMIGRIRRPSQGTGKVDAIVIDHAGACDAHCMPDEEIEWSLDNGKKIGDWLEDAKKDGKVAASVMCPRCDCMFAGMRRCPNCGHELVEKPKTTKKVRHADGILVERTGSKQGPSLEEMQRVWNKAIAVAVNKGRILGAAVHIFHQRFGKCPWQIPGLGNVPEPGLAWKIQAETTFPGFRKVKVS